MHGLFRTTDSSTTEADAPKIYLKYLTNTSGATWLDIQNILYLKNVAESNSQQKPFNTLSSDGIIDVQSGFKLRVESVNFGTGAECKDFRIDFMNMNYVYDADPSLIWTKTTGNDVYYTGGNVGIGTSSLTEKLNVDGNITATGTIRSALLNSTTNSFIIKLDNNIQRQYLFYVDSFSHIADKSCDLGGGARRWRDAYIGNIRIGSINNGLNATFAYRESGANNFFNTTDFALQQNSGGHTIINAKTGAKINFRTNGQTGNEASFQNGNFHLKPGNFLMTTSSASNYKVFTIKGWVNSDDTAISGAGSTTGTKAECLKMVLYNTNINYFTMQTKGYIWMVHSSNANVTMQMYTNSLTTNSQYGASDDRLKHNEEPINNALSTIRKLNPQVYDKASELNDTINTVREAGFIAQEVYEISELKHFVKPPETDPDHPAPYKYWSLNYGPLFTYNISATKELDAIVQTQQAEINTLKDENTLLKSKLNEILLHLNLELII